MVDNELNDVFSSFQRISDKLEQLKVENAALREELQQEKEKSQQWMEAVQKQQSQNELEPFLRIFQQTGEHFMAMGRVFSHAQNAKDVEAIEAFFQQKSENVAEKSGDVGQKLEEKPEKVEKVEKVEEKNETLGTENIFGGEEKNETLGTENIFGGEEKNETLSEENIFGGEEKNETLGTENIFSGEEKNETSGEEVEVENIFGGEEKEEKNAEASSSDLNPYDQDDFFGGEEKKNENPEKKDPMQMPAWLLDEENDDPFAAKEGVDDDELMKNLNKI